MNLLQAIFRDKLIEDARVPAISFDAFTYHVDCLAPYYIFFIQIFLMLAGATLSVIMYFGIVTSSSKGDIIPQQGYLIGFGFVIPVVLWLPFQIIEYLDIRSIAFRLGLISLPLTITSRCLESIFGFVEEDSHSLRDYVLNSGFIVKPCYDNTGIMAPLTKQRFGEVLRYHTSWLLCFAVTYHVLEPFNFYVFPTNVVANQVWLAFDVGHLYNTFVQAFMISTTLSFSVSGVGMLADLLTGVDFDCYITNNPMLLSTSPSDFWGRRWNKLIHVGLKQGIYKPVRWNTGSRILASIAAFAVSGIYHEYVWRVLFSPNAAQLAEGMRPDDSSCCRTCYCDGWAGKQMVFFCWNGVLVALENLLGDKVVEITRPLPQWLRSHLVVLLALPVGHLFTADFTESGYFHSIRQSLPLFIISKSDR